MTRGVVAQVSGHHLIYDAWLREPGKRGEGGKYYCSNYNEKTAPTVCLVGHDKATGQHSDSHDDTDILLEKALEKGKTPCHKGFSMECAIEVAAKAHKKMSKQCDEKCIKVQIKNYYDQAGCPNKLRAVNQDGKAVGTADQSIKKSTGNSF